MKKKMFTGWKFVYAFTIKQEIKGKSFKFSLILGMLLFFIVPFSISVITSIKEKDNELALKKVYVINELDDTLDLSKDLLITGDDKYTNIEFVNDNSKVNDKTLEIAKANDLSSGVLSISNDDKKINIKLYLNEAIDLDTEDGEEFLQKVSMVVNQKNILKSGISQEQFLLLNGQVVTNVRTIEDTTLEKKESEYKDNLLIILPMAISSILYMLFLMYGISTAKSVAVEKTSKIIETILTTVKPYAVVFGKIIGMTTLTIFQLLMSLVSLVIGIILGNEIGKYINPDYKSDIIEIIGVVRNIDGLSFLTPWSITLGLISACLGLLFYCVIGAMIISGFSKSEDITSAQSMYTFPTLIGFFASYIIPIVSENNILIKSLAYIPFISAFRLPGIIVSGDLSLFESIIGVVVMAITTVVFMIITGRIYMNTLFNKGNFSFKEIIKYLRYNH
ncbi:MAG: ABC transporter permease [Clostridiales bacterium]